MTTKLATIVTVFALCVAIFSCYYIFHLAMTSIMPEKPTSSIGEMLGLDSETALAEAATSDNSQLLARAINGEARGEPYIGQVAVGAVILNRTQNPAFPKTIPGVIYQPGAFTAVDDGQINVSIAQDSTVVKAAKDALNGWDPTGGAIYYFNPATATSGWIWSRQQLIQIGKHIFCK